MNHGSVKNYGAKTILGGLSVMADPNEQVHIDTDRARAGATPRMTRYILPISLVLVIAIFAYLVLV